MGLCRSQATKSSKTQVEEELRALHAEVEHLRGQLRAAEQTRSALAGVPSSARRIKCRD